MSDRRLRPDPERDVVLDARNLRGIAHPLRVRLLGKLRHEGPSTATRLGEQLGLSPAAVSYHLRQLAAHGFVVEDAGPPDKHPRERWWRAAHRGTWLEAQPDDPDAAEAVDAYLRAVAQANAERVARWLDERATVPATWLDAGTMSDLTLDLTAEQSRDLGERVGELLAGYHRHEPGREAPPGTRPVTVQWQVLPDAGAAAP